MVKQLHQHNGFSYIESLIVILIMLIILHMVSYSPLDYKKMDTEEVNDELLSVITYYQTLAMSEEVSVVILFPPGSSTMHIYSKELDISTTYTLRSGYFYAGNTNNGKEIIFYKDKINHGATVTYFINNQRFNMVFQLVKGRVRIERQ